ncbi:hypothetical protein RQP46_003447 [Phenoliferia psychrophenolica]
MGISEAAVMMQTISETGGGMTAASSVHMNVFGLEPVVKYGTEDQKARMLPGIIDGSQHTLRLTTKAVRVGDTYEISGNKVNLSLRLIFLGR